MSSSLRQVTVVPALTVRRAGTKGKLSILVVASSARTALEQRTTTASRQASPGETPESRDLTVPASALQRLFGNGAPLLSPPPNFPGFPQRRARLFLGCA